MAINNHILGSFTTGHLIVYSLAGNDAIAVGSPITNTAWLFGGAGKDKIIAGGGPAVMAGGPGSTFKAGTCRCVTASSSSSIESNPQALYNFAVLWEAGQSVAAPASTPAAQSLTVSHTSVMVSAAAPAPAPAAASVSHSVPGVPASAVAQNANTGSASSAASDLYFAQYAPQLLPSLRPAAVQLLVGSSKRS